MTKYPPIYPNDDDARAERAERAEQERRASNAKLAKLLVVVGVILMAGCGIYSNRNLTLEIFFFVFVGISACMGIVYVFLADHRKQDNEVIQSIEKVLRNVQFVVGGVIFFSSLFFGQYMVVPLILSLAIMRDALNNR